MRESSAERMAADPEVRSMAALCGMDVDDFILEQLLADFRPADAARARSSLIAAPRGVMPMGRWVVLESTSRNLHPRNVHPSYLCFQIAKVQAICEGYPRGPSRLSGVMRLPVTFRRVLRFFQSASGIHSMRF